MKTKEADKIEVEELIRLKDFHLSEYRRFKGLLEKKRSDIKEDHRVSVNENTETTKAYWKNRRKADCNAVHSILLDMHREVGTGELCDLLNDKMQYSEKRYDSMTFMTALGKTLKADDTFYSYKGNIKGRLSTVWGLRKWKSSKDIKIGAYR